MITKIRIVRTIAWTQLVISVLMIIGFSTAYFTYRSSIAESSRALASTVVAVSEALTYTAEKMVIRKEMVQQVHKALQLVRGLIETLKASVEAQGNQIPQYSGDLRKVAAVLRSVGNTFEAVGDKMMIQMPTRVTLLPPVVYWSRPWQAEALQMQTNGRNIYDLSGTLVRFADSMVTDIPQWNKTMIDSSQKTLELLVLMDAAASGLGQETLTQPIEALNKTAQSLRQASDVAKDAELWAFMLFAIGLLLAFLLGLNSAAMLLLAPNPTKE